MTDLTFWEHLAILRKTLIRIGGVLFFGFLIALIFHRQLLGLVLAPVHENLVFLNPIEGFTSALKVSFWAALIATSPIWLYMIVQFLLPALHSNEKKLIFPFLFLSSLFVTGGVLFAYFVSLPLVIDFFVRFNAPLGLNLWSFSKTLQFVLSLLLAHGLAFELFVALLILVHFGLLSASLLAKGRRYVILAIFILAAILTPPDVLSQLLLALPLMLLYESTILYAKFSKS